MPKGRFAPSPSGDLHFGSARTALVGWLAARRDGGSFVLRIEDIDLPRVVSGAEDRIIEDLRWLGLHWDEFYRQSARLDLYERTLRKLNEAGAVFPCFCTRADVARAASAPHAGEGGSAYPGTCRNRSRAEIVELEARGRHANLRFRAPDRELCFEDAVHGRVCRRSDDFVVRRADGLHAYQLAVVVDDIDMRVEEIVRGDDLLDSMPRQLLLYEALGARPPRFAHVPLVLAPDGERLAKRHGSFTIRAMRDRGVSAPRLVGRLAATLGLCDPGAAVSPQDLLSDFSFERLPKEPTRIDTLF